MKHQTFLNILKFILQIIVVFLLIISCLLWTWFLHDTTRSHTIILLIMAAIPYAFGIALCLLSISFRILGYNPFTPHSSNFTTIAIKFFLSGFLFLFTAIFWKLLPTNDYQIKDYSVGWKEAISNTFSDLPILLGLLFFCMPCFSLFTIIGKQLENWKRLFGGLEIPREQQINLKKFLIAYSVMDKEIKNKNLSTLSQQQLDIYSQIVSIKHNLYNFSIEFGHLKLIEYFLDSIDAGILWEGEDT